MSLARLEELIAPVVGDMGYDLVRVMFVGTGRTLQVMADRKDEQPMTVEDCADISRALSAVLDVEDPIPGAYSLEVSSPGIDRPLVRPRDFERFAGFEAKLETKRIHDGRKRFRGRLKGMVGDNAVALDTEEGEVTLALSEIEKAKLMLTDELIAFSTKPNVNLG
ncbi:MAG: ribosome maturation factor RimP [Alphaproteobacteria bacterium RIFOXYD12_FULL_60_8]|nr:MAG: ribosome maturation factor RimP [Alphaproteobacteria bacterium RIFOXYD12_FULL_60_8]